MQVMTIGLDLAKHVFQVHRVGAEGRPVLRKRLRRSEVAVFFAGMPRCVVGMEACATAHQWARGLRCVVALRSAVLAAGAAARAKLDFGHFPGLRRRSG